MRSQLFTSFSELAAIELPAQDIFSAKKIAGRIADYVTVGTEGEPLLLLSCAGLTRPHPPVVLRHLRVEFSVHYRVRAGTTVVDGVFTVISLRTCEKNLFEPFCIAGEVLIASLPQQPTAADIDQTITRFVEMLAAISRPPQRAIAGLWAELWLISKTQNIEAAINAWHTDTTDRFDFAFENYFVEVKSTESAERVHEFAYEQLRDVKNFVRVASLKLRRSANGTSISDLVEEIQVELSPHQREKLLRNVFHAIGSEIAEADELLFDSGFADTNLRVVDAQFIPAVIIPEGSPISGVRFRVNLDSASLNEVLSVRSPEKALLQ
jgi:hypothetical protein